jgi:hypothetical protein
MMSELHATDSKIPDLVMKIAREVFYSDAPITPASTLNGDLLATPVDILDLCRRVNRRLRIDLDRDELLLGMRTEPRACTLLWLSEQCLRRRRALDASLADERLTHLASSRCPSR